MGVLIDDNLGDALMVRHGHAVGMEEPLKTLFLQDLRSEVNVKFRPGVFYAVFATGFVLLFAIESLLLPSLVNSLPFRALPNLLYEWIALGLIAGLVSFKWKRAGT